MERTSEEESSGHAVKIDIEEYTVLIVGGRQMANLSRAVRHGWGANCGGNVMRDIEAERQSSDAGISPIALCITVYRIIGDLS